jgi:hypothetical protein
MKGLKARLWKEFRPLAPYWAVAMALPILAKMSLSAGGIEFFAPRFFLALGVQALVFQIMGVALFGPEFGMGTMERLLSQPVPRRQIWLEKMRLLLWLFAAVLLVDFLTQWWACVEGRPFVAGPRPDPWRVEIDLGMINGALARGFVLAGMGAAWALCVGPFMALHIRKTHTAVWATLVSPICLGAALISIVGPLPGVAESIRACVFMVVWIQEGIWYFCFNIRAIPNHGLKELLSYAIWIFPWCVAGLLLARRRFLRLEV